MPRRLRSQAAELRHVTARGNRRQAIFVEAADRERYLDGLTLACRRFDCGVLAWCLMTNHVHLVLRVTENTLSRLVQELHGEYAAAFNLRHGYDGHLFQGRFRDEHVEDAAYLFELGPYVDLNPVRAGAVDGPGAWRWSGYRALAGLERPRAFHDVGAMLDLLSDDRVLAHTIYRDLVALRRRATPWRAQPAARHVSFGHGGV